MRRHNEAFVNRRNKRAHPVTPCVRNSVSPLARRRFRGQAERHWPNPDRRPVRSGRSGSVRGVVRNPTPAVARTLGRTVALVAAPAGHVHHVIELVRGAEACAFSFLTVPRALDAAGLGATRVLRFVLYRRATHNRDTEENRGESELRVDTGVSKSAACTGT